jgi:hypothetical protein
MFSPAARLAGQEPTRLYLKDGSYQLVKTYEIHGDRVRYYSVERSDWEEIPVSMLDLDATRRARKDEATAGAKAIEKAQELEKEHFERPPDSGPQIAPGIRLPPEEGIYTYDGLRVVRLIQSTGEIVTDKKRLALSLALPAPVLKSRQFVELQGPKAAVRVTGARPTFFAQFADGLGGRLMLISIKSGKQDRMVERIDARLRASGASESRATLPLEYLRAAPGLFKLTPMQPLAPGEYAFAELIQGKLNLDVWDFGIDGELKRPSGPGTQTQQNQAPMSEQPSDQTPPKIKRPRLPKPLPDAGQSPQWR